MWETAGLVIAGFARSNLGRGYSAPRPTQPAIPPGSFVHCLVLTATIRLPFDGHSTVRRSTVIGCRTIIPNGLISRFLSRRVYGSLWCLKHW